MTEARGLKAMRKARRSSASQAAVAAAMGVSVPTYRKWEERPDEMTMAQAKRLAGYFGCSVEDVFYLPPKVK